MKKIVILAAVLLTVGVAKTDAGVWFAVSVGYSHEKGHGRNDRVERFYPPQRAPRYAARECSKLDSHHHHGHCLRRPHTAAMIGMEGAVEAEATVTGEATDRIERSVELGAA